MIPCACKLEGKALLEWKQFGAQTQLLHTDPTPFHVAKLQYSRHWIVTAVSQAQLGVSWQNATVHCCL